MKAQKGMTMTLGRRLTMAALTAAAALTLTACGSGAAGSGGDAAAGGDAGHGDEHTTAESAAEPVECAPEVTLTAIDIDYEPAAIELVAGEPTNVTVTNEGDSLHDFTLEQADVHLNVEPGETKTTSVVVNEPGTYEAVCTVPGHEEAGMTVDVVVSDG